MSKRISVIIPCYNQAQFLPEAIDSVLRQGRDDVEIIVVNDGSPDNTADIAQSYGDQIVYIEQENQGVASARNTGIHAAHGEYIAFLDADDRYFPGALDKLAAYLDIQSTVGFVCSDVMVFDETGDQGRKSAWDFKLRTPENIRWDVIDYHVNTNTVMVRREVFDKVGLFEETLKKAAEDWLMWVQIARHYNMAYIDEPLVEYRFHQESLTRQTEQINAGNRLAAKLVVESESFDDYPRHFRAKLLYHRFSTAWAVEPKAQSLRYVWRAVLTDPRQVGYLATLVHRAWRKRQKAKARRRETKQA